MKLLLTAFEPFDGRAINASQEIARAIQGKAFDGAQTELLYLPVERFSSTRILLEAIESSKPDVILLLGEAKGRTAVTPERVAINIDDYPIPDNGGNQPREETIIDGGPAAYFSTLPIVAIRDALNGKDVPAAISNSAGTYLCNRVFYCVMDHLSESGSKTRAGFVHIPLLAENRPVDAESWPSLPRDTVLKGIETVVVTCIQEHNAISRS
jgi:pyroglutamyl-peptidase